ncbi:MAG: DEAD/DEAH box helicase [Candidatus Poseidoniales archaeon]|jgi:ATP-dependent RNA helicase DeaD|tara:strand:+ start:9774 stop:11186 length:1413 start_codon:yes stop_codon:yes gene_type:complete
MSIFKKWNLESNIYDAIESRGWTEPTEIQLDSIPLARKGRDIVGQAKTGSGKTAAFGIPILEKCECKGIPQSIILCPTRELAVQVAEELEILQGKKGLQIIPIYGGTDIEKQSKILKNGCDIVVGTPGRVIDMAKRGHLKLEQISIFCLDEADRMLDMGFFPDILWIIEKMPNRNQNLLFSATFPDEVLNITDEIMVDAEHVMSDDLEVEIPEINLYAVKIGRANKLWVLGRIITNMSEDGQMLIFSNTKRMVDVIVERLGKFSMRAIGIHGDMPQKKRENILSKFKSGDEKILVATDVAARGLDVDGITVVVNYDLPDDTEAFVHRIGRTGRMGKKGDAWSLVSKEDKGNLQKISSTWGLEIPFVETPELPNGITKDPVRKRDDWDEVADSFGMVKINLQIRGDESTKRELSDWIASQAKIPEIIIGEISQREHDTEVEVHVSKVAYVIDVIKAREYNGRKLKPEIMEA